MTVSLALPPIKQVPSPNYSSRNGSPVRLFVVHDCEGSYAGSVAWFAKRESRVSAHLVLRRDGGEATQCVPMDKKAWHACNANPYSDSLELEGYVKDGFPDAELDTAAAIVAWGLHRRGLPPRWAEHGQGEGFCSHYDLGAAGGGHFDITTDRNVWLGFANRVVAAYQAFAVAGALPDWALHGLPAPTTVSLPPAVPAGWTPSGTTRAEPDDSAIHATVSGYPLGSCGDIQWRLRRVGANPQLGIDGQDGPATEKAVATFARAYGLPVPSKELLITPVVWAALEKATANIQGFFPSAGGGGGAR